MDSGSGDSDSESRGHSESVGLAVSRLGGSASASASGTPSPSRTHWQARHGWPGGRPSQAQAASQLEGGSKLSRRGYHKTLSLHRASDSGSQRRTVTRTRPPSRPGALDLLREELALGCEAMTRMPTAADSDSESEPTSPSPNHPSPAGGARLRRVLARHSSRLSMMPVSMRSTRTRRGSWTPGAGPTGSPAQAWGLTGMLRAAARPCATRTRSQVEHGTISLTLQRPQSASASAGSVGRPGPAGSAVTPSPACEDSEPITSSGQAVVVTVTLTFRFGELGRS
jgi:hypothetical protein